MDPLGGQQLSKFSGLFTDADPSDIPDGGFAELDNFECLAQGRLSVRKGIRRLAFSNETGSPADNKTVVALHRHHYGSNDTYLYQLDDGTIHVGLGPLTLD